MLACLHASRMRRSCSARFQALPSSLLKTTSPLERPANQSLEQLGRLAGEGYVACLPALALANRQRPDVGVVVGDLEPAELAVAAAGEERGVHQVAEGVLAGVQQPPDLVARQVADDRRVDRPKGFHAAPGVIGGHEAVAPG